MEYALIGKMLVEGATAAVAAAHGLGGRHRMASLSSPPDAARLPSGAKATDRMFFPCAFH